jgi:hypothetical protein
MDFSKKLVKDSVVVDDFAYPDGEAILDKDGNPCWIETAAPESEKFRKAVAKKTRSEAHVSKDKKRAKNSGLSDAEYDRMVEISIEFLADLLINWGGWEFDGEPSQPTRENAIQLYTNAPFVRKDVDAIYGDDQAFYKK